MPSWTARLNRGSPQSNKPLQKPKSQEPRSPSYDQTPGGRTLQDLPLHGVPVLASPARPSTSRRNSQQTSQHGHGRSYSHPLNSMIGNGHPTARINGGHDSFVGHNALPDIQSNGHSIDTEVEFTSGSCATCDTHVRWPRTLDTFRCTVCVMINDLKPIVGGAGDHRSTNATPQANYPKVSFISLDRTMRMIDDSIKHYLSTRLQHRDGLQPQAQTLSPSDQITYDIPSPTRAPPPPPDLTAPARSKSVPNDAQYEPANPQKTIFRNLENYIYSCFSGADCLNASFLTSDHPPLIRTTSENGAVSKTVESKPEALLDPSEPISEVDAKILLLGDFAENGSWWAGKTPMSRREPHQTEIKSQGDENSDRVTLKSPRINWRELNEWYSVVFTAGFSWRNQLKDLENVDSSLLDPSNPEIYQRIDEEMSEARSHVQQAVLKASELLLKRPGRPLRRAESCRFLLILLANPLLCSSDLVRPVPVSTGQTGVTVGQAQSSLKLPSPSSRNPSSSSRRSPSVGGATGRHSGIIKRILGLLSTVPVECHHYFISWFSRFEEPHFRRIVELIGSFVSYRLSRQHGRKRSNTQDPSGFMIPSISRLGSGNSAQLHAALGATTSPNPPDRLASAANYTEDWQVKAAARIMSLLFSANNNDPLVKSDGSPSSASKMTGRTGNGSLAKKRAHRRGQLLPTNAFYNTMLDYADLISDFDIWESRKRDRFTFCQYPMFLSIWAKIRILEYDARRQMEIMARDAFFNSIMSRKAVNQYLVLKVRRACLVEDSLRGVSEVVGTGQEEEIKKGLRIEFIGEEGLDSGGLRKEWFLLLVRDIFDPEHGLFVYDEDSRYCYFNPNTFETSDQFYLVGVLLGLAIYNSTILDVALPPFAFRKLLASAPNYTGPTTSSSRPPSGYSLDDLAEYQPALAQGLRQLLAFEGDVEETYCWSFVANGERYGLPTTVPLCPSGEQRPVTSSNRREFVDLYIRYLLDTSVARQYEPFKRGFFTVCGGNALTLFRAEEIELLVRGSDESLDVTTLQSVAIYENWGKDIDAANEPAVSWFWEAFAKAPIKDQRKLLSFITASDRIPAMGTTSLVIKILCLGDHQERFPIARTCFNMIALYKYQTQEKLEEKLWRAVADSEGFGMK